MFQLNHTTQRALGLISLILAGETIFFLPFVLVRIYRPTLLEVFNITNTELGLYFSAYGIVALFSYFLGGPLADKFPARNLLSTAMWLTGLGGFVMWSMPAPQVMFALYAFWGVTTILLFWAALIRATREWGGTRLQARAFGWLEGGRGATAALLGTLTLLVFTNYSTDTIPSAQLAAERINAFRNVLLYTSAFTLFAGVLTWWFVPRNTATQSTDTIQVSQIIQLLKRPTIWLLSIVIISSYVGYKLTDNFSLYAHQVLGFNPTQAAEISTALMWLRALSAILVGYLADRFNPSSIITSCFALTTFCAALLGLGLAEHLAVVSLLNISLLMTGVCGLRAIYFALIHEANIPIQFTGTAVGIVSVLGFTPDIFMGPWMGYLLDSNPGITGHQQVFLLLTSFSVIGGLASVIFGYYKPSDKNSSF